MFSNCCHPLPNCKNNYQNYLEYLLQLQTPRYHPRAWGGGAEPAFNMLLRRFWCTALEIWKIWLIAGIRSTEKLGFMDSYYHFSFVPMLKALKKKWNINFHMVNIRKRDLETITGISLRKVQRELYCFVHMVVFEAFCFNCAYSFIHFISLSPLFKKYLVFLYSW